MYKLLYGFEGFPLNSREYHEYADAEYMAEALAKAAAEDRELSIYYGGKSFIVVLLNRSGSANFTRHVLVPSNTPEA